MSKLILRNFQSPGDIVMLTAAVRDLHQCCPGQFLTDVRTPCPGLWENNPNITPLDEQAADVKIVQCEYPLIHHSNQRPYHFIHAFTRFLSDRLGVFIEPTAFKGDIHLSEREKSWISQVREITGKDIPFWIIVAGGKFDYTAKWWDQARYQQVVDHFQGKIQFVQVGEQGHHHPALQGVIDLRERTDTRQFVRLMYHAQGVLCPITFAMHLAAAVEVKGGHPKNRPCVVVAGGREPMQWEAYPHHQYIHTNGALACCGNGGCWKSRVLPLGDGDAKDKPENLCVDVVGTLPHCMDMITAEEVIRRIELYFQGGVCRYLDGGKANAGQNGHAKAQKLVTLAFAPPERGMKRNNEPLTLETALERMDDFIESLSACPGGKENGKGPPSPRPSPPGEGEVAPPAGLSERSDNPSRVETGPAVPASLPLLGERAGVRADVVLSVPSFTGRGIVICGGGRKYFPCAWVCIQMLRRLGCQLPVQIWHLGPKEMEGEMKILLAALGVECVDALEVRKQRPARILNGWELKSYAILHSSFQEVLLLDADNVPVVNPEFLFETPEFKAAGAIFWPDYRRLGPERSIWKICGVDYRSEPEVESGQILVSKERCWRELCLTLWMNEHSDFFYKHIHGDKDTFHLAWRKLRRAYAMPAHAIHPLRHTMCQHDFQGRRIFQHRNLAKWTLSGENPTIAGFLFEKECLEHLEQLRAVWNGSLHFDLKRKTEREREAALALLQTSFEYRRIGHDQRPMRFLPDGTVGEGARGCEMFWNVRQENGHVALEISSEKELTCRLVKNEQGVWQGRWEKFERMPVELVQTVKVNTPARKNDPKKIVFRAAINSYTGYGLHACQIIHDLKQSGYKLSIRATEVLEEHAVLPLRLKQKLVNGIQPNDWELLLNPPNLAPTSGKRTVYFTMWEASRLPGQWVQWLNQAECIIVPCHWNATCFSASGVDRPIHIVPLGINTGVFKPVAMRMDGPCVFGVAGKMRHGGGKRKGLNEMMDLFRRAFPTEQDVRLRVKGFPDCGIKSVTDPRVDVTAAYLTENQMAMWYASLTSFVSLSKSEGWGLMPHQAMAMGRPAIATRFGGHAEYLDANNGYCVDFRLGPAGYNYAGGGVWAEPDEEHVIALMRRVYQNREEARNKGALAAQMVSPYTWQRSNQALLAILKQVGMVA